MDKKLNGFNNGRDTTDGVGGQESLEENMKWCAENMEVKEKTMFDEMRESGSSLPDIVEFLQSNGWETKNHHDSWVNKNYIGEHSTHEAFKLEKEWQETPLQKAIEVLCNALREDTSEGSYYYSWQANIAMAFVDEYNRNDDIFSEPINIPKIANEAAKNFLNLLIEKK